MATDNANAFVNPEKAEAWKDVAINPATDPQDFMKEEAEDINEITESPEERTTKSVKKSEA